jgi:hypothetical protein
MSAASDLNDRMPDGGVEMILPNEMASIVIEEERSLLSTLTKNGVPITFAQDHLWGYDSRTIDYGTGLSYPAKAERARANPHVGLLFHRGQTEGIYMPHGTSQREGTQEGSILAIAADASVEDADLQATTDRWVRSRLEIDENRAPTGRSSLVDTPDASWADAVFYWVRMFINCTPKAAYLWPDGQLNEPPHTWKAPPEVVAPPSDPAPGGSATPSTSAPPLPWDELASRLLARDLLAPYLTLLTDDGYPLPFWTTSVELVSDGFRLVVPSGAPWPPRGKGCLNFESKGGWQPGIGGNFVGVVEEAEDGVLFRVDHAVPSHALNSQVEEGRSHLQPEPDVRQRQMERLEGELARRGASTPIVRRPETTSKS